MNEQLAAFEQVKQKAIVLGMEYGPKVLIAIAILVLGVFVARAVGQAAGRWLSRVDMEPPVRQLLLRLLRALVLALFVLIALTNLEIKLLPLIAGLGVAGAGVALAMQGVLGNLVAGLTIIFTRPFRVGEYVEMLGEEGRVESVELLSTHLSHPDRSKVVIPNRKIVGEVLHNFGRIRQLDLTVGVAYDTDLNMAVAAVNKVLAENRRTLKDPVPVVGVSLLADSSVNLSIKPWVAVPDYVAALGELNQGILEEFRRQGISIPFPQREIRILNDPSDRSARDEAPVSESQWKDRGSSAATPL